MTYNNYNEFAAETNSILGTTVTYLRDSFGRNAGIQATRGGVMFYDASYAYDTATGLVNSAMFNTSATFAFTYTPGTDREATVISPVYVKTNTRQTAIARLSEIRYNRPGTSGALLSKRNYTFDLLSRVTSEIRTNDNTTFVNDTFAYNNRSELTSAFMNGASFSYAFDDIGNRSSAVEQNSQLETYTANACNQYTEVRTETGTGQYVSSSFVHDDDGNITHDHTQCGTFDISYNAENRPVRFLNTQPDFTCAYDAYGRRIRKGTATSARSFLYAGTLQIAEFDVNPVTGAVNRLLYCDFWDPVNSVATKVLATIAYQSASASQMRFILHDMMKNACNAIEINGTLGSEITYTPFGMPLSASLLTDLRFGFSSEYYDSELGMTHYLFRDLNHKTGRWITCDPIGEQGGWNLYAFCGNDTLNSIDFFGYKKFKIRKVSPEIIQKQGKYSKFRALGKKISDGFEVLYNPANNECLNGIIILVQYKKDEGKYIIDRDETLSLRYDGNGPYNGNDEGKYKENGYTRYIAYTEIVWGEIEITMSNGVKEKRKRLFTPPRSINYTTRNGGYYDAPEDTNALSKTEAMPKTYYFKVKAFCRRKNCDDEFLSECAFAFRKDVDGVGYFIEYDENIYMK